MWVWHKNRTHFPFIQLQEHVVPVMCLKWLFSALWNLMRIFFFLQESESTSWMCNKNENLLILKFDFTAWIVGKLPFPVLQLSCTNKSDNFKIRKQFKMFNWNKCNEVCALCLHFRDLLLKREMLKVSPHTRLNYKQSSKNEDNFQRNESQNVVFPEYCATQHCCPF